MIDFREPLCKLNFLCVVVLRLLLGSRIKICRHLKDFKLSIIYASNRSIKGSGRGVVIYGFYFGACNVESYLAPCSHLCFFQSCLAL